MFLSVTLSTKVMSGLVPTCDSAHSWWFHGVAFMGDQATSTITRYPAQSHYPYTKLTSPCPIWVILSSRLGRDKYQFYKSLVWLNRESTGTLHFPHGEPALYLFSHWVRYNASKVVTSIPFYKSLLWCCEGLITGHPAWKADAPTRWSFSAVILDDCWPT